MRRRLFFEAACAGVFSGALGFSLSMLDEEYDFLVEITPDPLVLNLFFPFASLVATFRTSHAMVRFTEAAAMMHRLEACWYDAASSLVAFSSAAADKGAAVVFQETLLRLISVLS